MNVDLVPVKVGVVRLAVCIVEPDDALPAIDPHAVGQKRALVECRLAVDEYPVPVVEVPSHLHRHPSVVDPLELLGNPDAKRLGLLGEVDLAATLWFRAWGWQMGLIATP